MQKSQKTSATAKVRLAPLASLSDLQTLDISNTKVTDLSPLIELIRRDIPVKSSRDWWTASSANGISVRDCPLTNPPPEIVKQGNDAILNYFRERELGGVDRLYEAKMLILGEGRAGKTSLLTRLYQAGTAAACGERHNPRYRHLPAGVRAEKRTALPPKRLGLRWPADLSRYAPVLPYPPVALCAGR